ncbi:MAG: ATP-dependent helicase HrpB [Acidobacteriota bacterium]
MTQKTILPIDNHLPTIIESLASAGNLVLQAAPGAGKTTRVPSALLRSSLAGAGEVLVLEPRRLAARLAARHVAAELGERLGETVGYTVRFDEVGGPRTRLRFLTEGVLTRRLLSDPTLAGASIVILDEFHERHLQTDLVLALLRQLQKRARPDLRIVVMSATLDAGPIADYLETSAPLAIPGRQFEVRIDHLERPDDRPLAEQVQTALTRLLDEGLEGDVLVFLPGAGEIRRSLELCAGVAARHDLLLVPLHGDLPAEAQDLAVRPSRQRKVILSTNVAESSVTIDGVVAVIDSGLAREAGHSPWSGVPTLELSRISQAAAIQRAGRAGRTRPGLCRRLFTLADFQARPAYRTPEIAREDLAEPLLALHALGIDDPQKFNWFEAPPPPALEAAETLLRRLGALDQQGRLTTTGQEMLRYPVHPRQGRLLVEARRRGVYASGCTMAALIGERDILTRRLLDTQGSGQAGATHHGPSDLLDRLDRFGGAERHDPDLDQGALQSVDRVRRQLLRLAPRANSPELMSGEGDDALLISILAGYPDRVARRRNPRDSVGDLILASGAGATLAPRSVVRRAEFMVAVEAAERRERSGSGRYLVTLASAIEPDWLIDLPGDYLRETIEAKWNASAERVEVVERMVYDQLVVDERRASDANHPEVRRVLAEAAVAAGWSRFVDPDEVYRFLWRIAFIGWNFPELEMTDLGESDIEHALTDLCAGRRSFAELRQAAGRGGLVNALRQRIPPAKQHLLNSLAPETVNLPGRRNVRINYERDQAPWIASRLQDFIGMKEGPRIGGGRVALVLHLLAPNNRPVQVTTDLAGFWQRTYPGVRRELSRRYPRHAWPE